MKHQCVCGAVVQRPGDLVLTDGGLWGGRLLPRPRWPEGRGPPHGPGNMLTQHVGGEVAVKGEAEDAASDTVQARP